MNMDELRKKWDDEAKWKKEHPFLAIPEAVYDFFKYTIPRHWADSYYCVKWGFQRMFRGFDDRWYWSYYLMNAEQTLKVLKWMQENKHGSPWLADKGKVLTIKRNEKDPENVHARWSEALTIMIDGFQALLDEDDTFIEDVTGAYDHSASEIERKRLNAIWEKGSKLFIESYRGLWD